jgi:integrase
LYALRVDDVESGRLRVDQTIYEGRIKEYGKTDQSFGWVSISPNLEAEIRKWIAMRGVQDFPEELLFVTKRGRPIHAGNYLRRNLSRVAGRANIRELNHQILRRTTGTHFQKHGTVKDAQGHLRHANPETTLRYYRQTIPESLRGAVVSWDTELSGKERYIN